MHLSFIIPTHDRPGQLHETLLRLGSLDRTVVGEAELIVLDNASREPLVLNDTLPNGIEIISVQLDRNYNTAARNIGAQRARGEWLVMLDDDSSPTDGQISTVLDRVPPEFAAIGGEVMLPSGKRESGGLPEVFVGCGCAIRRDAFLSVGGYDESFGYYAEEYDLCAKLIIAGYRISHTRSLRFEHRKVTIGRDMNRIIHRLVRNNAWVMQRYAPDELREQLISETTHRYRRIADMEGATSGYENGLTEMLSTLGAQPRRPMSVDQWERFEGRAAVRNTIRAHFSDPGAHVRLVGDPNGKGRGVIESELAAHGCRISEDRGGRTMVGTLSPGPMLDTLEVNPDAVAPWNFWNVESSWDPARG